MAIFNFDSDNILMIGDSKYIMNYSEVEDRYTLENEINQNKEDSIFEPRAITSDKEGNVYILDAKQSTTSFEDGSYETSMKIFKFSIDRKFIKSQKIIIRNTDPEGYGYYGHDPRDIALDNNGNIIVLSSTGYRLESEGSYATYMLVSYGKLSSGVPVRFMKEQNNDNYLYANHFEIIDDNVYFYGQGMYDSETEKSYRLVGTSLGNDDGYTYYIPDTIEASTSATWNIYAQNGRLAIKGDYGYVTNSEYTSSSEPEKNKQYSLSRVNLKTNEVTPLIDRYIEDAENGYYERNDFDSTEIDDKGNIYLAGLRSLNYPDGTNENLSILKYNTNKNELDYIAKTNSGDGGEEDVSMHSDGFSVDIFGNIYIVDGMNGYIVKQFLNQSYPPSAPRGLNSKLKDNDILLTWQESADNGNTPIISYIIRYKSSRSGKWTEQIVDGNTSLYRIQVIAVNSKGNSPSAESFIVNEIIQAPNTGQQDQDTPFRLRL